MISTAYDDKIFTVFSLGSSTGEDFLTDFFFMFRPHSLNVWYECLTYKWFQLLRSRVVKLYSKGHPRDALTWLPFREARTPARPIIRNDKHSPNTQIGQARRGIQEGRYKPSRKGPILINISKKDCRRIALITNRLFLLVDKDTEC